MIAAPTISEVRLYVAQGHSTGQSIRVRGPSFLIGRAPDSQLRTDSPQVSRRHAGIDVRGEMLYLRDLGSCNGTFLNGERVARPTPLADGDRIRIGPLLLVVTIWGSCGDDDSRDGREGSASELSPEDESALDVLFESEIAADDSTAPARGGRA